MKCQWDGCTYRYFWPHRYRAHLLEAHVNVGMMKRAIFAAVRAFMEAFSDDYTE